MPSRKPPEQMGMDFLARERAVPAELLERPLEDDAPPAPAEDRSQPKVFTVAELVRAAARTVEARYGLVWVEGEVSNLSMPRSGHFYFTIKDEEAQLPSVMFRSDAQRLKFRLSDGLKVRARGRLTIYEGQGKFQMYVDALEPAGLGAQQLAFEQLKERLGKEGLFDAARKRPLPRWPRRVGVVTSATGAAVRDIIRIAERRGRVKILIAPCQVQGDNAAGSVIYALRALERQPEIDVIIVGRGGGSAEDLQAFNDERLARAIAACPVPVVSAVGHEVDFTIADFVADQRAATPSQAAELVVPLHADAEARLADAKKRLLGAGRRTIAEARQRLDVELDKAAAAARLGLGRRRRGLDELARRLTAQHPRTRLHQDRARLDSLRARMATRVRAMMAERHRAFHTAVGKLDALSPLSVLSRGYSLARAAGHVLTDASRVKPGDSVEVTLARGSLDCRVESTKPDHDD
jgi:exodeoxyribonuclease VII large subunit